MAVAVERSLVVAADSAALPRRPAPPVPRSTEARGSARSLTLVVEGEAFELPRRLLTLYSPPWRERLEREPELEREDSQMILLAVESGALAPPRSALEREAELPGSADSFRAFLEFLTGREEAVTGDNVMHILHWARELGIGHLPALCEEFLLLRPPAHLGPEELLEISTVHDMPLVYAKAVEELSHGLVSGVHIPSLHAAKDQSDAAPLVFQSESIRSEIVQAHLSKGFLRSEAESHRRQRFADYSALDERRQRARLLWKARLPKPDAPPPEVDWKELQTVWPHHSLRGDDWAVVPRELQPTMPLVSRGIAAQSAGATGSRHERRRLAGSGKAVLSARG
eukprot:TRINITY_DN8381_c0_g1_i1.p1 TRINITY_DN8381_c0_g1~~TRINITY_DN8381_c0_g1_i1.p1  ORF type:complete len:340 (-),score=76.84 TRINITY_DN8381_c0_g1_i1:43-1062(-)